MIWAVWALALAAFLLTLWIHGYVSGRRDEARELAENLRVRLNEKGEPK